MDAILRSTDETLWDETEVISLVQQLTSDSPFVLRDQDYASRRDLLFQNRFVSIPGVIVDGSGRPKPGMVQYRSPEIEQDGHAFKNRMLAAPLKIKVASIRKGQPAEQQAQRQQDFFYRHYDRWRDQGVFDGPLFDMATVGVGWTHLALNVDLLPIVPDFQQGDDPDVFYDLVAADLKAFTSGERPDLFVLEPIDPQTMYWSPDQQVLVQKALVPFMPLVEQYGRRGKQLLMDEKQNILVTTLAPGQNVMTPRAFWSRMVTLYTVETADYCYHVATRRFTSEEVGAQRAGDFTMLAAYKNYFGVPAFFPAYGEKTGDSHPMRMYRPLLNGKYQTVPVKNILTTSMMTAGSEAAQQRYALEWIGGGQPPEDDAVVRVELTDDGMLQPSDPRYKVVSSGLTVGPDLPAALGYLEKVDVYGYPKALVRPDEVSATSGYDRARQQDAVASLLNPPLDHFAAMLTGVFRAMTNAVTELDQPITVRSRQTRAAAGGGVVMQQETTLSPDDVKADTDISVSFSSVTVFSRIAMEEEGLKQMQADELTETEYQKDIRGIDDLPAWRDQRALDKVLKAADDHAVADAIAAIGQFADAAKQKAITDNNIPVPQASPITPSPNQAPQPMVSTNGQMLRSDRGPSIPVGAGAAMPVQPAPPQPAELGEVAPGA